MDSFSSPSLSSYINGLLDESYGTAVLSEDQRLSMHNDLMKRLTMLINTNLIAAIPQEKVPEFNRLIDTDAKENEITDFIQTTVSDPQGVIVRTLVDFREVYRSIQ
mgnify:CR=1 FL=1